MSNYRLISLTNCDYKILAYVLVGHIECILPHVIHPKQTAYMKGQFIGTNIRYVQDIIDESVCSGNNTIVLFLDFCKAFDSVNHLFLMLLLIHMGFQLLFVAWILTLYKQASSCIHYKNWLTPYFGLGRGIHQGCPLSCHLFNLVGQVLIYSL